MKELFINNIKCKIGNNAKENWKILDANLFFQERKNLENYSDEFENPVQINVEFGGNYSGGIRIGSSEQGQEEGHFDIKTGVKKAQEIFTNKN